MADYTISLEITGKDGASPALNSTHKALVNIGGVASSALGGVAKGLTAIAGIGLAGVVGGLGALTVGLAGCVKEAMAAENITAELNAVLKSTGGVSGMTAESINDIATSLSKVTRFEDDAIVQGQSMLLTFTNIGKDVFPAASEAMLDMAQKFGSMDAASVQLGKALNDPIAGVSALRRIGVVLTDAQEALIKKFMKVGDIASAQKVILAELGVELGGLARAAGNTLAGKLDILKNRLGNVKEAIGAALIPVAMTLLDKFIVPALPAIEKLADGIAAMFDALSKGEDFSGAADVLAEFAAGIIPGSADVIRDVGAALDEAHKTLIGVVGIVERLFAITSKGGVGGLVEALKLPPDVADAISNVQWACIQLGAWIQKDLPAAQAVFQTAWKVMQDVVMAVADVYLSDILPAYQEASQNISDAMAELGIDWKDVWEAVKVAVVVVAKVVGALLLVIVGLTVGMAKGTASAFKTLTKIWKEFAKLFKGIVEGISKQIAGWMEIVKGVLAGDWPRVLRGAGVVAEGWLQTITSIFKAVVTAITTPLRIILDFIGGFVTGVIKFFQNLYDRLVGGSIVPDMMRAMQKIIVDTLKAISDFISSILNTIVGAFKIGFDRVVSTVSSAVSTISGIVTVGFNALVRIIQGAWDAIRNGVVVAWAAITQAINAAISAIPAAVAWAIQGLVAIGASIVNVIRAGISNTWSTLTDVVGNLLQSIPSAVSGAIQTLVAVGAAIVERIRAGVSSAWATLTGLIGGFLAGLASAVWGGGVIQSVMEIGSSIVNSISAGLTATWDTVSGVAQTLWRFIADLINYLADPSGVIGTVLEIGASIVESIRQGIVNAWDGFINWIRSMIGGIASAVSPWLGGGAQSIFASSLGSPTATSAWAPGSSSITYNLYVTTTTPAENIVSDFGMMRALAGVG